MPRVTKASEGEAGGRGGGFLRFAQPSIPPSSYVPLQVVLGARAVTPAGDVVADAGALLVAQAATVRGRGEGEGGGRELGGLPASFPCPCPVSLLCVSPFPQAHGVPVVVVCSVLELVPAAVVAAAPWRDAQGSAAEVLPPGLAAAAGGVSRRGIS